MDTTPDGMVLTARRILARELLQEFARDTGLEPPADRPRRYLWTDAFAVCTYLGLFRTTGSTAYRELALRLIDQVHHTLGRYRDDHARTGWISGLSDSEGENHPTAGGLRIGKKLPERGPGEPYDERREWDCDGQYYHYLTRWMHALAVASDATQNPVFGTWAVELARTAQARFTFVPPQGGPKRMFWKMSCDLSRPLVLSMGQHDPLDGLVTYVELQQSAKTGAGQEGPVLAQEIMEIAGIGRHLPLETSDPLGTGGLLADASRIARLAAGGSPVDAALLGRVLDAARAGLSSFERDGMLGFPAKNRLAFRELGLAIGLAGAGRLPEWIGKNPHLAGEAGPLLSKVQALDRYIPLREEIEAFWLEGKNREAVTWTEHRDINTVMLAASLAPEGFLEW